MTTELLLNQHSVAGAESKVKKMASQEPQLRVRVRSYHFDPSGRTKLAVGACAMLIIAFDLTVVPCAAAWDFRVSAFLEFATWASTIFWSMDLILSFATGFYRDGQLITDKRLAIDHQMVATF